MNMDSPLSTTGKASSAGWGRDVLKIIAISAFFVGVALALQHTALRERFLDVPLVREFLTTGGGTGPVSQPALLFVLTFSLLIGVGLPRLWVSAIAGAAFGALWGTFLSLLASVAGAAIVYHFGRTLLAGILQRRIGARMALWQTRFQHNAYWWVLYMRLFPLSNATLAGLVCGACRIPVGAYLAGSLLGFIPLTIVFTVLGSGGIEGNFYQIAIGIGLLLLAVGVRKLLAATFLPPEARDAATQPEMRY